MLTSLYVRQFAVVEKAEIAFGPGLTVVSGETGAGKSLLVDALMLLAGARADSGMVRAGSDRAELAAEFDLTDLAEARAWLAREELDEDGGCQLRRVIRAEGSSRAWINGRPANARQLGELAALLDPRIYKVNLIPYNPTGAYDGSSPERVETFRAILAEHRVPATVRLTRGRDIDAACGQLAANAAARR